MSSLTFPLTFPLTAGDHPTASLTSWLQLQGNYFSFLPNPSFTNPLQTSLVPLWNNGSGTPTFTRASTAYQTDFSATLNLVLSGEARFQGARRVANLYASSAAFATTTNPTIAGAYTVSFTGTGTITFSGTNVGSLVGQGASTRVAATITTTAGTLTSTVTGTVTNAQLENVTGKANQNPSEYVDSATAYGAGVNAVQYFNYLNGNTVASNVVTQAQGAAIVAGQAGVAATAPVDSKGPYGYLAEGARTNIAPQSQTLNNASWNQQQVTPALAAYTAPDGTLTMNSLTCTASNNIHTLYAGMVGAGFVSGSVYTFSAYVRYVNNRWLAMKMNMGGAGNFYASFDLLNGVAGALSASTTSTIKTTAIAGVYFLTVTATVGTRSSY